MNDNLNEKKTLERHIIVTGDGSSSIFIPEMNESYHSSKGAIAESEFIYIEHGLKKINQATIKILEVGFGTGLNAILTFNHAKENIEYNTLEPFPLNKNEWSVLNYSEALQIDNRLITELHEAPFETLISLRKNFILQKFKTKLEDFMPSKTYDLIYFDAFAPNKQASPWIYANIEKCYGMLNENGLLVTYCSQGQFKRDLKQVGFRIENPPGPMGKREITLAYK
ncbi:MAG: tRNA (5-methylaminomethyl-2-thiouridine)(34)-methyltransferase MnmD [Bacteroidia bacterium]